jgi:prefoldin subunit 5
MLWTILIVVVLVGIFVAHDISTVGGNLEKNLDELHGKVDAMQEKLDEIEDQLDRAERLKRHVNPIDL